MNTEIAKFKRTKYTCYYTYLAMSSIFTLPPLLFGTFHEMYGISYTLLGTLVVVNFCTQLLVDLLVSFFNKYVDLRVVARVMPLLTSTGLFVYALTPTIFPNRAYVGLVLGTFLFSVAGGLCEVLLSPLVAALPSEHPERDMSMLHSLYAWGVVMVVTISTVFLHVCGKENWMYLTMFWALLPVVSFVMFCISPMPETNLSHNPGGAGAKQRNVGLLLCVLCIFFGSAAENAMTNWVSVYIESALGVPKMVGDVLGLALFGILLGVVRTLYGRYGRNIIGVLLISMIGATACYLTAGLLNNTIVCMIACILTGLFTSMLWPGSLIMMEEYFPHMGVAAYALMAAGGDFGASVAPQLQGAVVDLVTASDWAVQLGGTVSLSAEQIGMKAGMLVSSLFPIVGIVVLMVIKRSFPKIAGQQR